MSNIQATASEVGNEPTDPRPATTSNIDHNAPEDPEDLDDRDLAVGNTHHARRRVTAHHRLAFRQVRHFKRKCAGFSNDLHQAHLENHHIHCRRLCLEPLLLLIAMS